jgi:hypothetical protein
MDSNIRQLTCAIVLQAVKDYFDPKTKPEARKTIFKDLRSTRLKFITNDMSERVAEQLELHPEEIAERLRRNEDI